MAVALAGFVPGNRNPFLRALEKNLRDALLRFFGAGACRKLKHFSAIERVRELHGGSGGRRGL
jgi:hypothetical protein